MATTRYGVISLAVCLILSICIVSDVFAVETNLTLLSAGRIRGQVPELSAFRVGKFGGFLRLYEAFEREAAKSSAVLKLDAGDTQGSTLFDQRHRGEATRILVEDFIGFKAQGIGNFDFIRGPSNVLLLAQSASYLYVNSNFDITGSKAEALKEVLYEWSTIRVRDSGGNLLKFGLVGYVGKEMCSFTICESPDIKVAVKDISDSLYAAIDALQKAESPDYIICLSGWSTLSEARKVARDVDGIDILLFTGGGVHLDNTPYFPENKTSTKPNGVYPTVVKGVSNEVYLSAVDGSTKYIGRLDIVFEDGAIKSVSGNAISLRACDDDENPVDCMPKSKEPNLIAAIAEFDEQVELFKAKHVGVMNGTAEGRECQIAFINGGALRSSLFDGDVTVGDVLNVHPFGNTMATFRAQGSTIISALEHSASGLPMDSYNLTQVAEAKKTSGTGRFLQVAGLRVMFDMEADDKVAKVEVFDSDTGVWSIISTNAVYKCCTASYIRQGGDDYTMFRDEVFSAYDFLPTLDNAIREYLADESPLSVPDTGERGVRITFGKRVIDDTYCTQGCVFGNCVALDTCVCDEKYTGSDCSIKAPLNLTTIIVPVVVALVVVIVGGVFASSVLKKRALERSAMKQWQIVLTDLHYIEKGNKSSVFNASAGGARSGISVNTNNDVAFMTLARYKGNTVAVRKIKKEQGIALDVFVRKELIDQVLCQHPNIAKFVGASIEAGNTMILTEYSTRGSLEDVLHNPTYNVDWIFKYSLMTDAISGMKYLHSTPIGSHGHLKSSNCLVDARWSLKVTDFGLHNFKQGDETENDLSDYAKMARLLWTAPEVIQAKTYPAGTQKGDIYSFGIIAVEIITREAPYHDSEEDIATLIDMISAGKTSLEFNNEETPAELKKLVESCYARTEMARPTWDIILKRIKEINPNKSTNVMDHLNKMLEKYAHNLEGLVEERTQELNEEKKKTDMLLYRMLPHKVAESLKVGKQVKAESFDECTIFFSDIVGFTNISAESTPMQIVDLLNDLYTCFDAIIDDHDVYKVETIGDAYMVVSGIPERNGNRHAGEISNMSLDLLAATTTFTIRHMPERHLQLRIGLHSGPCVAGVVGLKMPRYCLFGDTVNTASRMESGGFALRIHLSSACAKILQVLGGYHLNSRGVIEVKGKGSMETFWLVGGDNFHKELPDESKAVGKEFHEFK